jgi:hypothetical protein
MVMDVDPDQPAAANTTTNELSGGVNVLETIVVAAPAAFAAAGVDESSCNPRKRNGTTCTKGCRGLYLLALGYARPIAAVNGHLPSVHVDSHGIS